MRGGPYRSPPVSEAVVLCAGASRRMGDPKGLRRVDGVPLLRRHVDILRDAGLAVTVVLGARAQEHLAVLPPGTRVVLNLAWATTDMADSAAMGLEGLGPALLTPVDVPPARRETLDVLLAAAGPAVPTHGGQDGHPVRLEPPHARARLVVRLRDASRLPVSDPDCMRNLNTPRDWAEWAQN